MTPGVSILNDVINLSLSHLLHVYSRLRLEILHNVQEFVIDVRVIDETNLHLVQIAKRVLESGQPAVKKQQAPKESVC